VSPGVHRLPRPAPSSAPRVRKPRAACVVCLATQTGHILKRCSPSLLRDRGSARRGIRERRQVHAPRPISEVCTPQRFRITTHIATTLPLHRRCQPTPKPRALPAEAPTSIRLINVTTPAMISPTSHRTAGAVFIADDVRQRWRGGVWLQRCCSCCALPLLDLARTATKTKAGEGDPVCAVCDGSMATTTAEKWRAGPVQI
jgi:hypothetical protein